MRSRRLAVHLRRLFDFVRETAEPVAASFSERGMPNSDNRFEVMVAPLASDGRGSMRYSAASSRGKQRRRAAAERSTVTDMAGQ
jgi:hypothetical protein